MLGLMAPSPSAYAQSEAQPGDKRCWYASNSFTVGGSVRQGDAILECTADGSWSPADKTSAACLLNGHISGVGAIVGVTNGEAY